ncbi:Polyribonucleotide 5'-hydroxyl-kinase [Metallosphaera sp. J1]|uniref:Clp1/GlmU family protein n=1 Tax=Metallosphaera javensis (ex Hofmann et al. 2022) TaxID=99938 RepID=UPI001EDF96FE|nr:Clp1/GlmU family protein [Metallosphaera javensis (ex Hofmann et al. 2022)]MCG3108581.1 Polyribonucleotide 5'-hydroxyl-kinase [Metallosphaera javensis (ex Hofmann et al. 2022)]
MRVPPHTYVIMRGPCEVRVNRGEISILGLSQEIYLIPETTFTVHSERGAEIESDCETLLVSPSAGWENVAELISATGGRVIVVGEQDSGKSYFSRMLYNLTGNFAYADLDVGQSSLFLPSFISMIEGSKLWFQNPLSFSRAEFFGDISPSRAPGLHLELSLKLIRDIGNLVVDTDGWTRSSGVGHKRKIIELTDPDYVIALGTESLRLIPREYRQRTILLRTPQIRFRKTRINRRNNRRELYQRYFTKAREIKVNGFGGRLGITGNSCYLNNYLNGLMTAVIINERIVGAGLMKVDDELLIRTPVPFFDDFVPGFISLDEGWMERRLT